jgi:kinetochore protein Mis12/MTW1
LIDDIINSVNNLVLQVLTSLEAGLLATPPEELGFEAVKSAGENGVDEVDFPDGKQELEEGLHKLETLLYSAVDKNFDKFEIYVLRNILSVPAELVNWVRLSHYEVESRSQKL